MNTAAWPVPHRRGLVARFAGLQYAWTSASSMRRKVTSLRLTAIEGPPRRARRSVRTRGCGPTAAAACAPVLSIRGLAEYLSVKDTAVSAPAPDSRHPLLSQPASALAAASAGHTSGRLAVSADSSTTVPRPERNADLLQQFAPPGEPEASRRSLMTSARIPTYAVKLGDTGAQRADSWRGRSARRPPP